MEPVVIRVVGADPLSGLEGVHNVRQFGVRVRLVDQLVQLDQGILDRALERVKLQPFLSLFCENVKEVSK